MHEYAFDVTLIAAIRVKAPDEETARRMLVAEQIPKDHPLSRSFVQEAAAVLMQMNFDGGLLTDYKVIGTTGLKDKS